MWLSHWGLCFDGDLLAYGVMVGAIAVALSREGHVSYSQSPELTSHT
ncbi:MAG: hypothetical protein GX358_07155 [candidate division WS1 bacterium]|nr:hypothetical protein [candidate division WS1 bacterium]